MNKFLSNSQLYHLILANVRDLIREPGVLFWGTIFPILMSLGLGIAFMSNKDVIINVAVIGEKHLFEERSDTSSILCDFLNRNKAITGKSEDGSLYRKFVLKDEKLGNTIFLFHGLDWNQSMILLKRGNLNMIIDEVQGKIQYHFDPRNPDAQLSYLKLSKILDDPGNKQVVSEQEIRPLTVTGTRYIDFLVPGLIAMGIMMSTLWGVSYSIIETRSKKLLRRMVATPMKRSNFLIALITVRVALNFFEGLVLFLFAHFVFGISITGNALALIILFIAGNMAFAGISILCSSHTSKTEIGNGLINAISMPMMVLSGIFFSYHNFPDWSIPVIRMFPLTMLADGMRIFIEGAGFAEVIIPVLVLSGTGVFLFLAGLKIFKWH
jgi:ABC-2 type transport system permease protein